MRGLGLNPEGMHPIVVAAVNNANAAIASNDSTRLHNARSVLDAAEQEYNRVYDIPFATRQKNTSALAISYQEVTAALDPRWVPPTTQVTTAGALLDDIFTIQDRPGFAEEEEEIRAPTAPRPIRDIFDIFGITKETEPIGAPTVFEAPPRKLEPEELPSYARAIEAGYDPEQAVNAARTVTFVRNTAATGNIAGSLTQPKAGSRPQPFMSNQQIADLVNIFGGVISDVGRARLQVQLAARQKAGFKIQLPPAAEKEIARQKFPWTSIAIGGAGLLVLGVLAYGATR